MPDVIDALVSFYRTTLAATVGYEQVGVLDGPESTDMGSLFEYVVIGDEIETDPDEATGTESTFTQSWAGLGAQAKTEEGSVACAVAVRSGDDDTLSLRDRRRRAFAVLAVLEAAQRIPPNGTFGGLVLFSAIESGTYRPINDSEGTGAQVTFTVTYEARI
jgi:hypothetical protein